MPIPVLLALSPEVVVACHIRRVVVALLLAIGTDHQLLTTA